MMHRTIRSLILLVSTVAILSMALVTVTGTPLWAAPPITTDTDLALSPAAQNTPQPDRPQTDTGVEYVIRAGDSLYAISGLFYDTPGAYQRIVDATNAKAETDPRFTPIGDARFIQTGQHVWIPNSADLPIVGTAGDTPSGDDSSSATVATEAAGEESAEIATGTRETVTTTAAASETVTSAVGVNFVAPLNGAVVSPTFVVTMTAEGLTVEPAGVINPDAGHFHILVDTDFVPAGDVIITDAQHIHFGKGQLTTTLTLEPGEHVLRLQFANGAHIALDGDQYQDTITVTVAAETGAGRVMDGPGVYFADPLDGSTLPPTFDVTMAANELTVEPAGIINPDAGHFHILVDTDFVPAGDVIITDAQHIHFGKGQLTTTLTLEPGEHVLRLQFANGAHIALDGDQYQDTITVTVAAETGAGRVMDGPGVYFADPLDGSTLPPTFDVTMAANELTVEPAGVINPDAGHFHILVDTDFVPAGDVIITDAQHIHFGKGQLTTTLTLEPGEHVLRLQFANGAHIALDGDQYQDTITVTVAAEAGTPGMTAHGHEPINVHFISPQDGATVGPRVDIVMGADGLIVEPAGIINPDAGHFHILVDTDFVPAGDVIITDDQHIHFGKGQAVTRLDLAPGEHTLRLQFANGAHIALDGEEYQDTITVTVEE